MSYNIKELKKIKESKRKVWYKNKKGKEIIIRKYKDLKTQNSLNSFCEYFVKSNGKIIQICY